MGYKHLFGPVPSRRLGVSLGVDLVPHKYCSLNCLYCEVGRTTHLTRKRDEYISFQEIARELRDYLADKPYLDYITFSGAGEPTLNSRIGDVVTLIKEEYPEYRIALITNSTLFADSALRREIKDVDLVLPSLDAVSNEVFEKINRPAEGINPEEIVQGLIDFRNESKAMMWLEVFVLPGVNDSQTEFTLLKEALLKINPEKIQLNSLDRPGTEKWISKEPDEILHQIADFLQPLKVEIITRTAYNKPFPFLKENKTESVLSTIRRRPCTAEDLSNILNLHINEINKYLSQLELNGEIARNEQETGIFYQTAT